MKGFVYVVTNESLPGLVKIGYSMKDPNIRTQKDFDPAALPHDYVVNFSALVDDPRNIESLAHAKLKTFHYRKEWFKVDQDIAIRAIQQVALTIYHSEKNTHLNTTAPSKKPTPTREEQIKSERELNRINNDTFWKNTILKSKTQNKPKPQDTPIQSTKHFNPAPQPTTKQRYVQLSKNNNFYFCPMCHKKNIVATGWISSSCSNCGYLVKSDPA